MDSERQGMEDPQVGDRELQAITARSKGTRTIAMTIQVDPGSLRAVSHGVQKPEVAKLSQIAPRVSPRGSSSERADPSSPKLFRAKRSDAGWL